MVNVAIVEDEDLFAEQLISCLGRYGEERGILIKQKRFYSGLDFIEEFNDEFDLVFMDIVMPHMDGMAAARELRKRTKNVCLIFLTIMAEYAIRGYEVNAFDFMLKPLNYELFSVKMDRIMDDALKKEVISVQIPGGIRKIELREIRYIESEKHYLYYHLKNETVRVRDTMRNVEDYFERNGFAGVNHSVLVNLSFVDAVNGNEVTVGERIFTVSRNYKTLFREKLTDIVQGV